MVFSQLQRKVKGFRFQFNKTQRRHTHTDISDQMLRDTHIHALLWPKSQKRAHTILTSGSFRPSLQPPANTYVCLLLIQTNTFKKTT